MHNSTARLPHARRDDGADGVRPANGGADPRLRLAYLNSRYPALSHTFIQREIEALRALGVEVVPVSIRRPSLAELGQGADGAEIGRTVYLLDRAWCIGKSLARAMLLSPIRTLRTILAAQGLAPGGVRARTRHLAYALEAIVLARELSRRGLDEIHVHMANNGAMVALLAGVFDARIRYSLTIHGSAEFFDVHGLRVRQKAERATFVRFVSDSGRAQVMAFTDSRAWENFHVVHCGVAQAPLLPPSTSESDTLRILAIGRLTPIKGYRVLLSALRLLVTRGVPWTLRVAGDGPDRASMEALAELLGIGDRVHFLGALAPSGVLEELAKAGVLVVSSFMEGVPVVLMEAMAAGVPVVSTRVGGVPELVEDNVTGLLVNPGSDEAIARALTAVWEDPQSAAQRATAARTRVRADFCIQRSAEQMRALFVRYRRPLTRGV